VVLVDSSVWIDLLREKSSRVAGALEALLEKRQAALAPAIYQEILQGASSPIHFERLREYFSVQPMLLPAHPVRSHEKAAALYARCRWKGFTPRSQVDCLIAQTAVEQKVTLLAHDRDFDAIARVEPKLRFHETL
jgi:predicted nucleic acid-binding protein